MAWQGETASTAETAAKADLKPMGRYPAEMAIRQPLASCHALAVILSGPAQLNKRRITTDLLSPRPTKLVANSESRLMIAENLAGVAEIERLVKKVAKPHLEKPE